MRTPCHPHDVIRPRTTRTPATAPRRAGNRAPAAIAPRRRRRGDARRRAAPGSGPLAPCGAAARRVYVALFPHRRVLQLVIDATILLGALGLAIALRYDL